MVVPTSMRNVIRTNVLTELRSTISHLGVGDNTTTPTVSDTTLGNETTREATFSESSGSNFVRFTLFLDTADNNGNTIAEAGIFNAGAGGTMYQRALTNTIAKDASTEVFVEVQIKVTFA